MPKKNEDKTVAPSLDELLDISSSDSAPAEEKGDSTEKAPENTGEDITPVESFENAEVAALRAELAKAKEELARRDTAEERPIPEDALTPEQRQIRQLQDELARTQGKTVGNDLVEEELDGEGILIHILQDGFNSCYRGQEIVFGPKAYEETKNRYGVSWLHMTDEEQYERWGSVQFRKGPWPGKKNYEDPSAEGKSIRTVARVSK